MWLFKLKKMAINFFLQSQDFGGAEKFAQDLLTDLAQKGQRVFLYTSNLNLIQAIDQEKNIKVEKIPLYLDYASNHKGLLKSLFLTPLALIYYLKILKAISSRKEKQFIFCSGFSEKIIVSPLAKLFSLQVFFIEYGPLEPLFQKIHGLPKLLYYLFARKKADRIIVSSKNTKRALKNIFPDEKMLFIPCGTHFENNEVKENKIKTGTITVVSRLEKGKGQDLLITAFKKIEQEFPKAELKIIGTGNFYEELKKQSQNHPRIKFLQFIKNPTKIIRESEIIVCPSVWSLEGFGLVVIEAMALRKAIVAFDRPPYNEILKNKDNALLAINKDSSDLAEKIISLMKNKSLQNKLARKAYLDFQKKYQIGEISKQYLALLKN